MNPHLRCKDFVQIVVLLILFLSGTINAQEDSISVYVGFEEEPNLVLSESEKEYIQQNPVIRVSNELDWPPFDYAIEGKPQGFSIDYLKLLEQKIGIEFQFVNGMSWSELVQAFKDKQLDVLHSLSHTTDRERFAEFSPPYFHNHNVFVTRTDHPNITSLEQLYGKTVAMGRGWSTADFLKKNHPQISILIVENELEMITSVASGFADATILYESSFKYHSAKNFLTNIKSSGIYAPEGSNDSTLHIAVQKDTPELLSILVKAMDQVTVEESKQLTAKWFGVSQSVNEVGFIPELTEAERDALIQQQVLRVGYLVDQPPFSFQEKNQAKGYLVELFEMMLGNTDITIEWLPVTHEQGINKLNIGKLDVFFSNVEDPFINRSFSQVVESSLDAPFVAVSRTESKNIKSLSDLNGIKVASVRGFTQQQLMTEQYPDIKQVMFDSIGQAYQALRNREVDYYIDNAPHAGYSIKHQMISDLKIAGSIPEVELGYLNLGFFVRSDQSLITNIMNQALSKIPDQRFFELKTKWSVYQELEGVSLTFEEREFLEQHGPVRLCVYPSWMPLYGRNNEVPQGFGADIAELVSMRAGFSMKPVFHDAWRDVYESVVKGRCDLAPIVTETPFRAKFLDFSRPYSELLYVIATQDDKPFIDNLEDVPGRAFAVLSGSLVIDVVNQRKLNLNLVEVSSTLEGLNKVLSGEVYGLIDASSALGYQISKHALAGVKINGSTNIHAEITVATRKNLPLLGSIVDKAFDSIGDEDIQQIRSRWFSVKFEHGQDYALLIQVSLFAGLILVGVVVWNRRLSRFNAALSIAHEEIQSAHHKAETALTKVETLLNNSGEGFLSFDQHFRVGSELSQECFTIFGRKRNQESDALEGSIIHDLLFENDTREKAAFIKGCSLVLKTEDSRKQRLFLELLPETVQVEDKTLRLRYSKLNASTMMLVIKDISEQVHLEKEIENEQARLRAVVYAIVNQQELYDFINDYRVFWLELMPKMMAEACEGEELFNTIYRQTHTFKGLAMQSELSHVADMLHELESRLDELSNIEEPERKQKEFRTLMHSRDYENTLQKDMLVISSIIGVEFLRETKVFKISDSAIDRIINYIKQIQDVELKESLLLEINKVKQVDISELIRPHIKSIQAIADRLGKQLLPFHVEGERIDVHKDRLAPFCKQLTHVFRNCIVHGIEMPDERVAQHKSSHGRIRCEISRTKNKQHVVISISDDGAGIDVGKLRDKAVEMDIVSQDELAKLSEDESLMLIFKDSFTTTAEATKFSGRGVGLSSLLSHLEDIGGYTELASIKGKGTVFRFYLPIEMVDLSLAETMEQKTLSA